MCQHYVYIHVHSFIFFIFIVQNPSMSIRNMHSTIGLPISLRSHSSFEIKNFLLLFVCVCFHFGAFLLSFYVLNEGSDSLRVDQCTQRNMMNSIVCLRPYSNSIRLFWLLLLLLLLNHIVLLWILIFVRRNFDTLKSDLVVYLLLSYTRTHTHKQIYSDRRIRAHINE